MTSRERMHIAMSLGTPDRVPFMCQLSIGHMLQQLRVSPVRFWHDAELFAGGLVALRDMYDFDGILVSLHGHDPDWQENVLALVEREGGEQVLWSNGRRTFFPNDDLPQLEDESAPKPDITTLDDSDLPERIAYIPVSQGLRYPLHPNHCFDVFSLVRKRIGDRYSLHGEVTSPFDYFLDLFGHEQGLMNLIDEPERSAMVLEHYARLVAQLAAAMCDAGVDAIKISSPFAGAGFISTEFYSKFVLPFEGTVARAVREKGVHVYTHTCGMVGDRLELMFDAGVSGIECLDPPPLGDVELEDAKRRTKGRGFIKGNVDSVNILLRGTDEEILRDARRRIEIGKEGGGFIFSTACSVAPHVGREKLQLLRTAIEEWG